METKFPSDFLSLTSTSVVMMSLALKSGGSVSLATVAKGATQGAQVQSQVMSSGREVSLVCVCVCVSVSTNILFSISREFSYAVYSRV